MEVVLIAVTTLRIKQDSIFFSLTVKVFKFAATILKLAPVAGIELT
jgi:hypothetical protein